MGPRPRTPRIYVSHPRPSAGTPVESSALRALATVFPGSKIVNPLELFHSNEEWLARYRSEIRNSSALVFFPYRGTIGYGVYCELCAAEDAGLPVYLLAGGKLWNTWNLSILDHRYVWKRFARVTPRGHPLKPSEIKTGRTPRLLPSGPLGRVIENRMIEYLIVLSDGRLIVYRPESDFGGTDLQVSLLHSRAILKIQVKGRTEAQEGRFIRVGVKKDQILPEDPKHLLFVQYDKKVAEPGKFVWFMSSDDYRKSARFYHGYWKADLSTLPTAKDRWVDLRYNTKDIAWVVEEMLKKA